LTPPKLAPKAGFAALYQKFRFNFAGKQPMRLACQLLIIMLGEGDVRVIRAFLYQAFPIIALLGLILAARGILSAPDEAADRVIRVAQFSAPV
jgi:hypothetical protein